MARTQLFRFVNDALLRAGSEPSGGTRQSALTRRQMLRLSAAAAGVAALGATGRWPALAQAAPRSIAIVGAGVAGLTAAYRLEKAGHSPVLFEASNRVGGRMMTLKNFHKGMFCELGGEFVDSSHEDLRTLSGELGVALQALDAGETGGDLYHFGGVFHTPEDMIDPEKQTGAFRPIAEQIAADSAQLLDAEKNWTEYSGKLDAISLKDYLEQFRGKAPDWAIDLLSVAYLGEFGLEPGEQSCLNLVDMIGTELDAPFKIFGDSDEAFRIKGGSSALIDALAAALKDKSAVRLGHALTSLAAKDGRVEMAFDAGGGGRRSETFDVVILTLPFTRLRQVEGLDGLDLSPEKLRSIRELGYGTNAKLMVGTPSRVWRGESNILPHPSNGSFYSDQAFQTVWETSRGQPGEPGILTNFLGGKAGEGREEGALAALRSGFEAISPRIAASLDKAAVSSFFWARQPFTLGSYASARPGQYTTLLDVAAEPALEGRLQFAGEHTSADFLGYMNGGVQSGNRAAEAVLKLGAG